MNNLLNQPISTITKDKNIDEEEHSIIYSQLLLQQDGYENHEELENGKFWFEMYQRIKTEISKER